MHLYSDATAFVLVTYFLFIFMGLILQRSGIAEDMYTAMRQWFGPLPGGLAIGTVGICTVFAAMAGISAPAIATMGLIAVPAMLSRGYSKDIALGSTAAGGALGILIPPSITFILFGLITGISVGKLFMGGLFPGLLLATLFSIYVGVRCWLRPKEGPPLPREERGNWGQKIVSLKAVILPIFIVLMVLGSILFGIASPSEAAGMGVVGSIIALLVTRRFSWQIIWEAALTSLRISCMGIWIYLGAHTFTAIYIGLGAIDLITEIITAFEVNRWLILIGMQLTFFILGMFLDPIGIMLVTCPIFVPIIKSLGFDVVWFGVLYVMNMEMGYLTPPFGYNLFYLKGVVPKEVSMLDVYRSVIPFVILQAVGLAIVMIFPQIALWLPGKMIVAR
jgi:tripartite ATP-independent transporter DctM subunit